MLPNKRQKHENNIQQWMKQNLTKTDYDLLMKEIPKTLGITDRTWYYYRSGITQIGLTTLSKVSDILRPYGCEGACDLIRENCNN